MTKFTAKQIKEFVLRRGMKKFVVKTSATSEEYYLIDNADGVWYITVNEHGTNATGSSWKELADWINK